MAVGSFEILEFGDSFFPAGISINFDGSAVAGEDYLPAEGTLTWGDGESGEQGGRRTG